MKIFVKQNLCEGQLDRSLGRVCQKLIVDGQASEVLQPGERTIQYPSFGKYGELGRALVRTESYFHCPFEIFGHLISKSLFGDSTLFCYFVAKYAAFNAVFLSHIEQIHYVYTRKR